MGWIEKGISAPFEDKPIPGLFFIDGDFVARKIPHAGTEGQKYPTIVFPSGVQCDLWESSDPNNAIVHISGEMDLPLKDTRDTALGQAQDIAEQVGYLVRPAGEQGIDVFGTDEEHIRILYDATAKQMANVLFVHDEAAERPKPELLDAKTREALPPLYSGEKLGSEALAQVKFFTPDGGWTWYGSEFDGEDIFFGLVDGLDLELGYFSLSELSEVRGKLGLPIERDHFFEPTSLKDLKAIHEKRRTIEVAPAEENIRRKERDEAERLTMLKDDLLQRFEELPPEHQATMALVVVNRIIEGEWGAWFTDAIIRKYLADSIFPVVDRDVLRASQFSEDEIAQISDDDLISIAKQMREHYVSDMFGDEVFFHAQEVLESKHIGKSSEGDTPHD